MRRPLCLIGLAFAAILMIWTITAPRRAETYEILDKENVTVAGVVEWKERRILSGEETLVITLKQAVVLKPDQASVLTRALADSEIIQGKEIKTNPNENSKEYSAAEYRKSKKIITEYCEKNKSCLTQAAAEDIEGILCYMEKDDAPAMGSFVIMEGKFRAFSHASNPGEFDAADYYQIMGQQGKIMQCRCMWESKAYDGFREKLYQLKEYLALLLNACYPEEKASVMRAMLLGEKSVLEEDTKDLYQQNGIIHILSISGLHLSVLGMGLHKLLKRMHIPKLVDITLCIAFLYCYGTMTGMGISIVRALIMFAFRLGAELFGRTYDMLTAMTIAAISVLAASPLYLGHSGFLFSFGAICGIGLLLPEARENLLWKGRLSETVCSGVMISITTLPVYLSFYYEFPPYSVCLNLLVIPCMAYVLLCGLATLAVSAFFLQAGKYAAVPGSILLDFYRECCKFCLKLPNHKWITGSPAGWQIIVFLLILAALVLWNRKLTKLQFWQGILTALMVLTIRIPVGLEITIVDVGQGDCIYLSDDRGRKYLIDGGSSDKRDVAEYQMVPFLKYKGADRLDMVFVTHPDSDHENGIRQMLTSYEETGIEIGTLVLPDVTEESKNEAYRTLEASAKKAGVPVFYIHAGEAVQNGELMLTCLHPEEKYVCEDTNAYSIVLYLTYKNFSALFTGDLEGEGEQTVTDGLSRICDGVTLLKVAHHGSGNSTGTAFLEAASPAVSVISCGKDNSYGHPHAQLLHRLEDCGTKIYRTTESGAVTVRTDGKKVWVEEFK